MRPANFRGAFLCHGFKSIMMQLCYQKYCIFAGNLENDNNLWKILILWP